MKEGVGVADFISFFLNIPRKWNNLVSVRPNYFIFVIYLKNCGQGWGSSEPPEPPLDPPLIYIVSCILSVGNMVDISHSPTPNGYHRASPCSSPGIMVNKGMARQSPPLHNRQPGNHPGPPRIMVPDTRNNMMNEVNIKPFDTLMVLLKELFENVYFEKKISGQLKCMQKVKAYVNNVWSGLSVFFLIMRLICYPYGE